MRWSELAAVPMLSLTAMVVTASPVLASSDCPGYSAIDDQGGEAAFTCPKASNDARTAPTSGRGAAAPDCTEERAADRATWWLSYEIPDDALPFGFDGLRELTPPAGLVEGIYMDCFGQPRTMVTWVAEPEAGSADDTDGVLVAREAARARVEPATPVARVSPEQAVVRLPTWLWVEESYWQPSSAEEVSEGGVAVGVEARPVEAVWDLGEGVVRCPGPGMAWDAAAALPDGSSADPRACTFTFVNSSSVQPAGVYDVSVTVVWEFAWSLDGVDQGVFGTVEVSDGWPLRVGEVQAVITG